MTAKQNIPVYEDYLHIPGRVVLGAVERLEAVIVVLDLGGILHAVYKGVSHVYEHVRGQLRHDGQRVPVPVGGVPPTLDPESKKKIQSRPAPRTVEVSVNEPVFGIRYIPSSNMLVVVLPAQTS